MQQPEPTTPKNLARRDAAVRASSQQVVGLESDSFVVEWSRLEQAEALVQAQGPARQSSVR